MGDKGTATWNAQSYEDFCSMFSFLNSDFDGLTFPSLCSPNSGTHLFLGTEAPTPTTLEYIEDLPHPFAPRDCAEFANVTTEQIDIQGTGDSDPAGRINYNVDEDCEAFPVTQFTPEQEPPPRPWPLIINNYLPEEDELEHSGSPAITATDSSPEDSVRPFTLDPNFDYDNIDTTKLRRKFSNLPNQP